MTATYKTELEQIVQNILATMIGIEAEPFGTPPDAEEERIVGSIQITGAWSGCVLLHLPKHVALPIAAGYLGIRAHEVGESDLREVAAELANMVGGNLKSALPGPSFLSLPNVVTGREYDVHVPSAAQLDAGVFSTPYGPLQVSLFVQTPSGS